MRKALKPEFFPDLAPDICSSTEPAIIAPGVSLQVFWWGWLFAGTQEALLSAGIAQRGSLPGDPGQKKTVAHVVRDGRKFAIQKTSVKRLEVRVSASVADELAQRQREQASRPTRTT